METRFRDTDAMGHVNNAVYLTYLEIARTHYWRAIFGPRSFREVGFILARVEIDYRAPLYEGDELVVGIRASRFGTKSYDFEYALARGAGREEVARAHSVQVMFDYAAGLPIPIPAEVRTALESYEAVR